MEITLNGLPALLMLGYGAFNKDEKQIAAEEAMADPNLPLPVKMEKMITANPALLKDATFVNAYRTASAVDINNQKAQAEMTEAQQLRDQKERYQALIDMGANPDDPSILRERPGVTPDTSFRADATRIQSATNHGYDLEKEGVQNKNRLGQIGAQGAESRKTQAQGHGYRMAEIGFSGEVARKNEEYKSSLASKTGVKIPAGYEPIEDGSGVRPMENTDDYIKGKNELLGTINFLDLATEYEALAKQGVSMVGANARRAEYLQSELVTNLAKKIAAGAGNAGAPSGPEREAAAELVPSLTSLMGSDNRALTKIQEIVKTAQKSYTQKRGIYGKWKNMPTYQRKTTAPQPPKD